MKIARMILTVARHMMESIGMKSDDAYPAKTEGSETAEKMRARANNLSDPELARHHSAAMQKIYGGSAVAQAPGPRH
jgi:hypothetical protein